MSKCYPDEMKRFSALTIIEVLIVVSLITTLSLPLYFSYTRTQAHQSLKTSSEQLADTIRSAHLFSRESRDEKSWGVKRVNEETYALIASPKNNPHIEKYTGLETFVTMPENFEVWFDVGTGETNENLEINLENKYGRQVVISVYKTGVVDLVTKNPNEN